MSSEETGDFSKVPDHVLARVLGALDLQSRLQLTRVSKRFWHVCFASHRRAVWREVVIPRSLTIPIAPMGLEKYEAALEDVCNLVESLVIILPADFTPDLAPVFRPLPPVMSDVRRLNLGGDGATFEVNTVLVHGLAHRFPGVVSICAKGALWEYESLAMVGEGFPSLMELEVCTFTRRGRDRFNTDELGDLLVTLDHLQLEVVRVAKMDVRILREPGVTRSDVDLLAGSRWFQNLSELRINFMGSAIPPETSIADFGHLERLKVFSANDGIIDWLRTIRDASTLQCLHLQHYTTGFDRIWGGCGDTPCFPAAITRIRLVDCSDVNERLVDQITLQLASLKEVKITSSSHPFQFQIFRAVQRWVAGGLEKILLQGPVGGSPGQEDPNTQKDVLRLLYNHFMENPGYLIYLKSLELNLFIPPFGDNGVWTDLKLDPDCDLNELARRLPDPRTLIRFSENQEIFQISN